MSSRTKWVKFAYTIEKIIDNSDNKFKIVNEKAAMFNLQVGTSYCYL